MAPSQTPEAQPAALPFCSQPLLVLASAAVGSATGGQQQPGQQQVQAAQQQQQGRPQQEAGAAPSPPLPAPLPGPAAEQQEDGECMDVAEPQRAGHECPQLQQQAVSSLVVGVSRDSEPALPRRTLHCFYQAPPPGCPFLPLAVADSCGELLHAELLDTSAAQMAGRGLGLGGSSTDSLHAAAPGMGTAASRAASRVCQLVLERCQELLGMLQAASSPPGLLDSLAIAATDMQQAEQEAWRQLVGGNSSTVHGMAAGAELAVLDLHAHPPAR